MQFDAQQNARNTRTKNYDATACVLLNAVHLITELHEVHQCIPTCTVVLEVPYDKIHYYFDKAQFEFVKQHRFLMLTVHHRKETICGIFSHITRTAI